jgi:hypothetical protein
MLATITGTCFSGVANRRCWLGRCPALIEGALQCADGLGVITVGSQREQFPVERDLYLCGHKQKASSFVNPCFEHEMRGWLETLVVAGFVFATSLSIPRPGQRGLVRIAS